MKSRPRPTFYLEYKERRVSAKHFARRTKYSASLPSYCGKIAWLWLTALLSTYNRFSTLRLSRVTSDLTTISTQHLRCEEYMWISTILSRLLHIQIGIFYLISYIFITFTTLLNYFHFHSSNLFSTRSRVLEIHTKLWHYCLISSLPTEQFPKSHQMNQHRIPVLKHL